MDELDNLKKSELCKVMVDEEYSQEEIDWLYRRRNAEGLRSAIRNYRGLAIIARVARGDF